MGFVLLSFRRWVGQRCGNQNRRKGRKSQEGSSELCARTKTSKRREEMHLPVVGTGLERGPDGGWGHSGWGPRPSQLCVHRAVLLEPCTGMSMKGGTKRKPELRGLGGSGGGDRRTCESKVSYVYCLTERKRGWEGKPLLHWRGRGADDPVRSTELAQLTEST